MKTRYAYAWFFLSLFSLWLALGLQSLAAATLAVVHESDTAQQRLGSVDSDGVISLFGSGQSDCCQVSGALATMVPGQNQLAMIGGRVGTLPDRLLVLNSDTGVVDGDFSLPAGLRVVALATDLTNNRVVALAGTPGGMDLSLYQIDTGSGVWTLQAALGANCCSILAGIESVVDAVGRWYVVGRLQGETDWRLLTIDLMTDSLTAQPVLAVAPVALVQNQGVLYSLYHDDGSAAQFVASVDAASGNMTPIGSGEASCCESLAGVATVVDGTLQFVARSVGGTDYEYRSVDLSSGVFQVLSTPPGNQVVNALVSRRLPVIAQGQSLPVDMSEDGSPTAFQLTLDATDPDGLGLSWTVLAAADHGVASVTTGSGISQAINYVPQADYFGSDSFQIAVQDASGDSDSITVTVNIAAVNDAPAFIVGPDQNNQDNDGAIVIPGWATGLSTGPANESAQSLMFQITDNTMPGLFSAGPAVSVDGTLSYTVARGVAGSATVALQALDNGGTANGGNDTSATQAFTISVSAVTPVIQQGSGVQVSMSEDSTPVPFALDVDAVDPLNGTLTWMIRQPPGQGSAAITPGSGASQSVSFTPLADANGTDQFEVQVMNSFGETDTLTVEVTIVAINDAPGFVGGGDVDLPLNPGVQNIPWATDISAGPANENGQSVSFEVINIANPAMFAVQPSVDATGQLSFEPLINTRDQSDVTLRLRDDGGTADNGVDVSADVTFRISSGLVDTTELAVSIGNGTIFLDQGQTVQYQVEVTNNGFEEAIAATLINPLPVGLSSNGWTCTASAGASCTASGNGDINDSVDVPVGASLTYHHNVTVTAMDGDTITNSAEIQAPVGLVDISTANNTATDVDSVGLLVDGFEAPE